MVGNVWFPDEAVRRDAEARLASAVRAIVPTKLKSKAVAIIKPSVELLFIAVKSVGREIVKKKRGKRYGDPLLDALRELVRYANARPIGGGRIGTTIPDRVRQDLLLAVFGQ